MPFKRGRGTYKGYESPNTHGWPKPIREEVRKVYGAWRQKNPGEDPEIKARGSRIAWSAAEKKYPVLYAKHTLKPTKDPKPESSTLKRKAQIRDLKAASQEQREWSKEAENEAKSEGKMAKMAAHKGQPVRAKDLRQDSHLAHDFSISRKKKADNYDLQAARIAAVKGDD